MRHIANTEVSTSAKYSAESVSLVESSVCRERSESKVVATPAPMKSNRKKSPKRSLSKKSTEEAGRALGREYQGHAERQ